MLVAAGVGNYIWYSDRDGVVVKQQEGIAATQARIADLDKTIGEVKNINTRKNEVEKKLAVLDELRQRPLRPRAHDGRAGHRPAQEGRGSRRSARSAGASSCSAPPSATTTSRS